MLLNEEGLDINYSCEDGHSALYSAAKNGHTGKDGTFLLHCITLLQKDDELKAL
jgi:ankyrin repeat protein